MKRKFKLLKHYPGTQDWIIGQIVEIENPVEILKYPDFWHEVKEETYKILSLKFANKIYKITNEIITGVISRKAEIIYKSEYGGILQLDSCFTELKATINSIERLSDGEIFTIGDKVTHKNNVLNKNGTIISFEIVNDTIFAKTENYITNVCFLDKFKKPFFITHDGVEVKERQFCYWVIHRNTQVYRVSDCALCTEHIKYFNSGVYNHYRVFSTKEAADKYVADNRPKPILVTEDGKECFDGDIVSGVNIKSWQMVTSTNANEVKFYTEHKWFSSFAKRDEYILMNKPCLSVNDVLSSLLTKNEIINIAKNKLNM